MATGENMVLKRKANEFRVWRAASSVNWDCTATEIAEELNLVPETVRKICRRRGWELLDGFTGLGGRHPVDRMMKT
jgi:uncharacterized protein YjcR